MEQYLIDTNVVSDYFSASFSPKATQFMDQVFDAIPNLSVITQIELLSLQTDLSTDQKVKDFITDSRIVEINEEVITLCVNLRRSRRLKTPDAIIAGTALALNYTLVTNNESDFSNIRGLKIINPYKL